jgi:hypothetical protein
MSWKRPCAVCGVAPVAFTEAPHCFACWPGGPVTPPPCLKCGSTVGYFTNGLCGRCHQMGPDRIGSCTDCYAWGATRHRGWRCIGCTSWRQHRDLGTCRSCGRSDLPLAPDGGCRLCRKQRSRVIDRRPGFTPDLVDANRHGQQLFFADMFRPGRLSARRRQPPLFAWPRNVQAINALIGPPDGPVTLPRPHRQERLFDWPRDLSVGRRLGFADPPCEQITAQLMDIAEEHGAEFGWSRHHIDGVRGALRILLATQETPGAAIRASEIKDLGRLGYSLPAVSAVLIDAGMFDDDREPAIVAWFQSQIIDLPEPMRSELTVWFDIMRNGSSIPPRRKPRHDGTTATQLRNALPSLRHWAQTHQSLREITNDHIRAALPASGSPRALRLQAFRSIFRILKARQLVFTNPAARFKARNPDYAAPVAVDVDELRSAIADTNPARAAIAALLAYHAIRVMDLRLVRVTDLRDGRLHVNDHTVLLAAPVRECVAAYLEHRQRCWPNTANPHLFINQRSALYDTPVNTGWITKTLGMPANRVRRDRILDEAFATNGDLRQLTDLFGVSVATADRFATWVHRAQTAERAGR